MTEIIFITIVVSLVIICTVFFIKRTKNLWETPSPSITPTPEDASEEKCAPIIQYLETVETRVKRQNRADEEEVLTMLFKLKNRWKIIYAASERTSGSNAFLHPKIMSAAADRDKLEVQLMDKGIEINYPKI